MYTQIWLSEEKIEVLCVGHFTVERAGYYAGTASVENFKVFHGNDNVTAHLDKSDLSELEAKYLNYCMEECA
jgi:hypothetical protein